MPDNPYCHNLGLCSGIRIFENSKVQDQKQDNIKATTENVSGYIEIQIWIIGTHTDTK